MTVRVRNNHSWWRGPGDVLEVELASGQVWVKGEAVDLTTEPVLDEDSGTLVHSWCYQ